MTTTIHRPEILVRKPALIQKPVGTGTLCLFRGPTPWIDPARKLVTPLSPNIRPMADNGEKVQWQDAGMIHRAIMSEFGSGKCDGITACALDHDPHIQHSRDGLKLHSLHTETPAERYLRRVPEWFGKVQPFASHGLDPFREESLSRYSTGWQYAEQPAGFWASPDLEDEVGSYLSLDCWPETFDFGNGSTCNSWVPLLVNGERRPVLCSWAILAPEVAERMQDDPGAWRALRRLVEGGQTSNFAPCREVSVPTPDCPHVFAPLNTDFPYTQGCRACGAVKIGRGTVIITDSYLDMAVATPGNPAANRARWYSPTDATAQMRDDAGATNDFVGGAAGAVTRLGGQLTEGSTASTSFVDIVTATVTTTDARQMLVLANARKTAGAAADASYRLAVSDGVTSPQVSGTGNFFNATNAAASGIFSGWVGARIANYLKAVMTMTQTFDGSSGGPNGVFAGESLTAAMVTGITSIVLRGAVNNALITLAFDEMNVYEFANS